MWSTQTILLTGRWSSLPRSRTRKPGFSSRPPLQAPALFRVCSSLATCLLLSPNLARRVRFQGCAPCSKQGFSCQNLDWNKVTLHVVYSKVVVLSLRTKVKMNFISICLSIKEWYLSEFAFEAVVVGDVQSDPYFDDWTGPRSIANYRNLFRVWCWVLPLACSKAGQSGIGEWGGLGEDQRLEGEGA